MSRHPDNRPQEGLYDIKIKGESGIYPLTLDALSFGSLTRMLSDLTGYRQSYLTKQLSGMEISPNHSSISRRGRTVSPASLHENEIPYFIVTRVA